MLAQADETTRTGLTEARRALQALRAAPLEEFGLVLAPETTPPSPPAPELPERLTPCEEEVLRLLAQGLSNPEIVERLNLSAGTARNYASEAFARLGVSDRAQAAVMTVKLRLI